MDESLKERLTGAAILVVLVVALVPEMFRGSHSSTTSLPIPPSGSGAPIQTYTIDLNATPVTPALAPALTPAPVAAAPAPQAKTAPLVAVAPTVVTPQPEVPPAPVAATPAAKPVAKPATPATDGAQRQWVVQVGSFALKENAARMVRQAARKGIKVSVAGPDDRGIFRVRTAAMSSRQAALEQQARLKSQGLNGIVNSVD